MTGWRAAGNPEQPVIGRIPVQTVSSTAVAGQLEGGYNGGSEVDETTGKLPMTLQLPLLDPQEDAAAVNAPARDEGPSPRERLLTLLASDLDFHDQDSYGSHNFHAFPAKFPPQLPRKFILGLTQPGDVVLDPMMGSGTTIVEAVSLGRRAIGFDIDPLAARITRVKVTPLDHDAVAAAGRQILAAASARVTHQRAELLAQLDDWRAADPDTLAFISEWFELDAQVELLALKEQIAPLQDAGLQAFFELALSAIIITKSGGVSLALDLAHTRPHKPKIIINRSGEVIVGMDVITQGGRNLHVFTKTLRSPLEEFSRRWQSNLKALPQAHAGTLPPDLRLGCSAEKMPLEAASVDLIVTSPPYASNAIDYMRAHKFSLVWLGYPIAALSQKRREYIGGEVVTEAALERLPAYAAAVVEDVRARDRQKGRVLHLYYSEMTRVLREMHRVLRPGRAAVVVVGSSVMRGRDTETHNCLAAIGRELGFVEPMIGERQLDRDRRMMPAGMQIDRDSQIQQRMHVEYVIGFYKP